MHESKTEFQPYTLLYVDPPWAYSDKNANGKRGACFKYPVLTLSHLKSLPIAKLAAENSALAMWWVSPMPQEALEVVSAWGFQLPWVKASSMPESVRDRASNSIESWVMLTKKQHYYWDTEAITQEATTVSGNGRNSFKREDNKRSAPVAPDKSATHRDDRPAVEYSGTRTRRTGDWMFETIDETIAETRQWIAEAQQWVAHAEQVRENQGLLLDGDGDPVAMLVNPRPFAGAHFAAFPEGVVTPIIQAATSAHGCCSKCGSPYRRIVERVPALAADGKTCTKCGKNHGKPAGKDHDEDGAQEHHMADYYKGVFVCMDKRTVGWEATCACGADVIPCTVLDPFMGSGTTLKVATGLNRSSVGVDISQEYIDNVLPIRFESGVQIGLQF